MAVHWLSLTERVEPGWWRPLEELATRLGADADKPPIDVDDFVYAAWARPDGACYIHIYRNVLTGRYLNVDETGGLWVWVGKSRERPDGYAPAPSCDEALARADLARAELLAARTRRGPRRPGWVPPAVGTSPSPGQTVGDPDAGGDADPAGDAAPSEEVLSEAASA